MCLPGEEFTISHLAGLIGVSKDYVYDLVRGMKADGTVDQSARHGVWVKSDCSRIRRNIVQTAIDSRLPLEVYFHKAVTEASHDE